MQGRGIFLLSLLALVSTAFVADSHPPSSPAQQKYTGELSPEQRRAIDLSISTNPIPSGFFSNNHVPSKLRFKAGEQVHVGIVMMNTASECVKVCAFSNPYYQNRPELVRDGEPVVCTERISSLIRQSDGGTCELSRVPDVLELSPDVPLRVSSITLQEWYGPLEPGHYKLTLKRTFACCADGALKSSNEIRFEVAP